MTPINGKIQLDIQDEKIGAIQSDSIAERGVVIAVGDDPEPKVAALLGKTLFVKSWAIDVITHEGKKFYFIDPYSDAICAVQDSTN